MTHKRKILITGAGGTIGKHLTVSLANHYDIRAHYRRTAEGSPAAETCTADITILEDVLPIMEGIDTVLHLAGDPRVPASWEDVLQANIVGMYNVLEAAHRAGVRRVVFASTNHVMGMHDVKGDWPVNNQMPQRPDSYYGVSKAFGEDIGRYYWDKHGLEFIAVRIGWYQPTAATTHGDVGRAMWLSPRDCTHAFQCAIESAEQWGVFYAISNNPNRRWDTTDAIVRFGYRPQDSWTDSLGIEDDTPPGTSARARDWGRITKVDAD
jgi:NAD+ dependent glucose-6-phosphate dehydrogenase